MSDLILTATTTAHTQLRAAAHTITQRLRRQDGQDIVEYGGMLVLIAGIVGLLFALNVPQSVGTAFANALNSIFSGANHTSYTAPTLLTVPKS